ncbi:MAG: transglutaminase family protein [Verrucomicrobia bacterium]|nr:transglutaminase family protein [Verrucomicrobiota bacterium]
MHLRVVHRTTFSYDGKARESFNELRLRPADTEIQRCLAFALRISPAAEAHEYRDFHGNTVHYFDVPDPHPLLCVTTVSRIETVPLADRATVPVVSAADLTASPEHEMLAEFHTSSPYVPLEVDLWREAQDAVAGGRTDVWSDVQRLGEHVHRTFTYRANTTGVHTLATDALRLRTGVCQDFAHVHLGLCRSLGIPARYVSGYFFNASRRPRENEASHAWIEAWLPGAGWIAYDPTHARPADDRYIRVAVGRDYTDIRPVSGTYRGAPTRSLRVDVCVRQVRSSHRFPPGEAPTDRTPEPVAAAPGPRAASPLD